MDNPAAQEAAHFRRIQLSKYTFWYTLNAVIPNNSTLPCFIDIDEDADFMIEKITGSCLGPTDLNGVRSLAGATDFDMAGTTAGYADRGLSARITDVGAGRNLTKGFLPLETLLSPGYGLSLFQAYLAKYFARKNSKIQWDIFNRDTAANLFHAVSIVLHGSKYCGEAA